MDFLTYLESLRTPVLTNFFAFFTHFGEELIILMILCSLYWCFNKNLAYRICFSFFLSGLCIQLLKLTFRVPRPWIKNPDFHPVKEAMKTATGYSFPSGHTQSATSTYGAIAFFYKKPIVTICSIFLIVGVGLSRMYLGVHTPQDVLCSFFVTIILTFIISKIADSITLTKQKRFFITIGMILVSIFAIIYSIVLIQKGIIPMNQGADCYKAGGAGIGFAIGWFVETTYIQFDEKITSVKKGLLRLLLGALIAVVIKVGWKQLLGVSILADVLRYMVLVLWLTMIYPFIIKKSNFLN